MHKKCQCVTCMESKEKYYVIRNEQRRKKAGGIRGAYNRGPYSKNPAHGTSAKYKRGCKCELCRKANADKARLQKQARKLA